MFSLTRFYIVSLRETKNHKDGYILVNSQYNGHIGRGCKHQRKYKTIATIRYNKLDDGTCSSQ